MSKINIFNHFYHQQMLVQRPTSILSSTHESLISSLLSVEGMGSATLKNLGGVQVNCNYKVAVTEMCVY